MYQSFETPSHREGAERLALLRGELAARDLDGFIVPRTDRFQGENVPAGEERLRWLTGFTGSAGLCIVLRERAAVFVDGRYTLQASEQLDGAAFKAIDSEGGKPSAWLAKHMQRGAGRIGYDPWLLTVDQVQRFAGALEGSGAELVAIEDNPIDAVWQDRPPMPAGQAQLYPEAFAGRSHDKKRAAAAQTLAADTLTAFVLTQPDSVNWLLNIRGTDVPHTPLVLAFAVLGADASVDLFLDEDRVSEELRSALGSEVRLHPQSGFRAHLAGMGATRIGVERASAPRAVMDALREGGSEIVWAADPCTLPKARKSAAEQAGARAAQLRDGAAVARFLCWFDRKAPEGKLSEVKVAKRLERYRNETDKLEDISFDSISAYGPNAALPHYRVNRDSNRRIEAGSVYLIDSGGQYRDGTTDITRTVAVGEVDAEIKRCFTLVLKGMIAVSRLRFPPGTTGVQVDTLARAALWRAGLDFNHGTGHGVGAFLGVHEGPASLSKRGTVPLEAGMILSNEPGYYREGAFGIRIENLLLVNEAAVPDGGERAMHGFETLTLAPIDLRLVEPELLDAEESAWLDAYHARVYEALFPLVDETTREWLEAAAMPLAAFAAQRAAA